MRKALIFAACFVSGAILACGSSLTSAPGDGGGKDGGTGHDATIVEASEPDTGRDARPSTDTRPTDSKARDVAPSDADAAEPEAAACLPQSPDSTTGLFVLSGAAPGTSCGTTSSPCATIDLALGVASTNAAITTIYVGPGPYTESATVALPNGIAIIGGWNVFGSTWTHDCKAPTIQGPSPVFSATSLSSPTTLDTLDIVETTTAGTGVSLYGITSFDSTLVLSSVSVTVQPGGPGQNGAPGGTGGIGMEGGCSPPGTASVGGVGGNGAPTGHGSFGPPPGCFTPASDGTSGATGGSGSNGTIGGVGSSMRGDPWCTVSCDSGTSYEYYEGGTGFGGCPGPGGMGGLPASGGGCSIGVYAWGGSVAISGGSIKTGNGGVGGTGGNGGPGGSGAPGAQGLGVYALECDFHIGTGTCTSDYSNYVAGGAAGSKGGSGGVGGKGGGGAGGCSYAYYVGGGATVTPSGVALDNGSGGAGGPPDGAVGPSAGHN
jgi:hypothetical protein